MKNKELLKQAKHTLDTNIPSETGLKEVRELQKIRLERQIKQFETLQKTIVTV